MTTTEIFTYNRSEVAAFSKAKDEWGELGNMTGGFGLVVNQFMIKSTESLYQAMRFPDHPEIQKEILSQTGGMGAKMVAKKYRATHTREDWDEVNVTIMHWCLQLKLAQHPDRIGVVLQRSGTRDIVEISRNDAFWGAIPSANDTLVGENILGRLWMLVRDAYLSYVPGTSPNYLQVETPAVGNMRLLGVEIKDVHNPR